MGLRPFYSRRVTTGVQRLEIAALLSVRALVQVFFFKNGGNVIDVQAIHHARIIVWGLNNSDIAVAVIITWRGAVEDAASFTSWSPFFASRPFL